MSSEAVKIFAVVFTLQILRRLCLEKMEAHEQRFVTSSKLLFLLQLRAVVSSFLVIVGRRWGKPLRQLRTIAHEEDA